MPQKALNAKSRAQALEFEKPPVVNENEIPTEIVCICDRSGSMEDIKSDAIGGFNAFLKDQKSQPGVAIMTIVLFDDRYEVPFSAVPINEIKPFTNQTFVPRGRTALLDAIGRTVTDLFARNPQKAVVMILTDGHENASQEYNFSRIKEMMSECETRGWFVAYISADMNAFDNAASVGIKRSHAMHFSNDGDGIQVAHLSASLASTQYRAGGTKSMSSMLSYSNEARDQIKRKRKH